jgi:trimethylamine--corrinoid protein Co-methyltransferase
MTLSLRPRLVLLSPSESNRLHRRSVELLWQPGVQFGCGEALDLLEAHGCTVDRDRLTAHIPASVVDRALATAPRVVKLAARNPAHDLALDGAGVHFAFGRPHMPPASPKAICLADALNGIEIINMGDAHGLPALAAGLSDVGSHLRIPIPDPAQVPLVLEMANAVSGGQSVTERGAILSVTERFASPLEREWAVWPQVVAAMALVQHRIPIVVCSGPAANAAPLDGVVAANAGFLASLVLYQCVRPGAPLIYGLDLTDFVHHENLSALLTALGLARRYGVPISVEGLSTVADHLGPRCGWEGALAATLAVLAGVDEVQGAGLLASGQVFSPEKAVHDAEQVRQLRRMAQGIAFDDERLMAAAIERVGIGGHYLLERETRKLMRAEVYTWRIRDDRTQAEWLASGRDERGRLAEEAERLLATRRPLPWPAEAEAAVVDLLTKDARIPRPSSVSLWQREEHAPLPGLGTSVRIEPRLTLLDAAACGQIHDRSLAILQHTGIRYPSQPALHLLAEAGCRVNFDTLTAWIPPALVERCLASAPREVALASRNGRRDLVYQPGGTRPEAGGRVMLSSQGQRAIDLDTGQERASLADDLCRAIRLADALDQVDIVTEIVNANDRDLATGPNFNRADILANSAKHFRAMPESPAEAQAVLEMGAAVAGSSRALVERPILSGLVCAVSPLSHHGPVIEAGLILAEAGVPLLIYSMPLAGATGPITVAGMALLSNVELLSQVVLYQIARPGLSLIYGAGGTFVDLRTAVFRGHTQETDLLGLALCDLAHWYGLPVNVNGLSTGAHHLGLEAFANGTRSGLVYALARADELFGIGLLNGAQTLSLEKLFLDAEIVRVMRAIVAGEPGSGGAERQAGEALEYEWAAQRVRQILASHQPDPLPDGLLDELYRIAAAYVI